MSKGVAAQSGSTTGLRWVALLVALSQLVTPPIIMRVYGEFLSTGATNDAVITPARYAFSIWGLITLLCAITFVAVVRVRLGAPWEGRLLVDASVVFVGFTAWLLIAAQDWTWLSVAVLAAMVTALVDAVQLLVRHADDVTAPTWQRILTTTTFGLYLGWSSVAIFINVAAALVDSGLSSTETTWQAIVLVAAAVAAIALTCFLRATPGYVAGTLWGLVAAAIGASERDAATLFALSAAAAAAVVVTAALVTWRGRADRAPLTSSRASVGTELGG
jgi:hypothetical protein